MMGEPLNIRPPPPARDTLTRMEEFPPQHASFCRICFIGDAFTVGAGDETVLGWVGRLAAAEWARRGQPT
jgi:hypothetical protein